VKVTQDMVPEHRPGLAAANLEWSISELEVPQDCILGHFQPSLRDWVVSRTLPRTTSWATLSRPYGTQFGEGSSHTKSGA